MGEITEATHADILKEISALRDEIRPIREDMGILRDMIRAWQAASWFGRAIKWLGGFATAIAAAYAMLKGIKEP